jgi:DNA polymerase IV
MMYTLNMVDKNLPFEVAKRPLKSLFLDLNAYFASVEQQEDPSLRGRPVAVVPTMADSTSVIAASYEAKRYGIKCGTKVGDARLACPDLVVITGQHKAYTAYHKRIIKACEQVLPVDKVCSIDEMRFVLLGSESSPGAARDLALQMKKSIRENVGEYITSSIGIAPNHFLSKLATDMQKPDGLVIIQSDDLPHRLYNLELTDFCGINRRMKIRLNAAGIFSVQQMMEASKGELTRAFGSILGEKYWFQLRGQDIDEPERPQKSLGHSPCCLLIYAPNTAAEMCCCV